MTIKVPPAYKHLLPDGIVKQHRRVARADDLISPSMMTGSSPRIQPVSRPCAVWVRTSPSMRMRSRITCDGAVENLRQVAARLLLHQDRRDQKLQVARWDALAHLQQRIAELQPQPLLLIDLDELNASGSGDCSAIISIEEPIAWPARSARAISSIASGSAR